MSENTPLSAAELRSLPRGEYGFPGSMRDSLVGAILGGAKTATTSLVEEYTREGTEVPAVGALEAVVDSEGEIVCVTRVTGVRRVRLREVDLQHAQAEGDGFHSVDQWRAAHEEFWASPEFVAGLGEPPVTIDDDTEVLLVSFEVIGRRDF